MRTFIALELDAPLRNRLKTVIGDCKRHLGKQSWVRPDNLHLTLKFLGEVGPNDLSHICRRLEPVAVATKPVRFDIARLGCFPDTRRPRVVWCGFAGNLEPLRTLQAAVDEAMYQERFPRERKGFTPHITLARVRSHIEPEVLEGLMERYRDTTFGMQTCTRLILMESSVGPDGSEYTPLATFPFRST